MKICYECGILTTSEDYNRLIICDVCDGEYYPTCVNLELLLRNKWKCPRCVEEESDFANTKYDVNSS